MPSSAIPTIKTAFPTHLVKHIRVMLTKNLSTRADAFVPPYGFLVEIWRIKHLPFFATPFEVDENNTLRICSVFIENHIGGPQIAKDEIVRMKHLDRFTYRLAYLQGNQGHIVDTPSLDVVHYNNVHSNRFDHIAKPEFRCQ